MIIEIPKGENRILSPNFRSGEFDCKCQYDDCKTTLIDTDHVRKLQSARDEVGPLTISSAYRCKKHNADQGGAPDSQHPKGTATDLVPRNVKLARLLRVCMFLFQGVGLYDNFVHTDSRKEEATWISK